MEAGMLVQEWTVSEVWVSEHDGVRSTYAGELWGRLRLVNPTFGFEHGFLSGSCARLIHVSSRPRPGVRVPPTRPYPLERYPVVEAVGFRPCLDQHLDALLSGVRRLRPMRISPCARWAVALASSPAAVSSPPSRAWTTPRACGLTPRTRRACRGARRGRRSPPRAFYRRSRYPACRTRRSSRMPRLSFRGPRASPGTAASPHPRQRGRGRTRPGPAASPWPRRRAACPVCPRAWPCPAAPRAGPSARTSRGSPPTSRRSRARNGEGGW